MTHPRARRAVAAVGRGCIAAGVLIILFVAYQLWDTGLSEARAQDRLRGDFLDSLAAPPTDTPTTTSADQPAAAPAVDAGRELAGEAVALLRVPRIGIEKAVIEGVSVEALKKGPGHYPTTPLPGEPGNAAIAGHRTTYGAPFYRLDELEPGDRIEVTTRAGDFAYAVTGSRVVKPHQNEVLAPTEDNRLTLTTCNPRYSAAERLIVTARLLDEPTAPVPAPTPPNSGTAPAVAPDLATESVSGESVSRWPTLAWGSLAAAVWICTALLARKWGRVAAYSMGTPVFLIVLFVFYENVARLLPANV